MWPNASIANQMEYICWCFFVLGVNRLYYTSANAYIGRCLSIGLFVFTICAADNTSGRLTMTNRVGFFQDSGKTVITDKNWPKVQYMKLHRNTVV